MKIAVQVIDKETGQRTKCNAMERNDLGNALESLPDKEKYLVLVIMEETSEGWDFSQAPIYSAEQFMEYFGDKKNG